MQLAKDLRTFTSAECNISGRSFNAQMKYANKLKATYLVVLGENEIKNKECKIKHMQTGNEFDAKLDAECIFDAICESEEE